MKSVNYFTFFTQGQTSSFTLQQTSLTVQNVEILFDGVDVTQSPQFAVGFARLVEELMKEGAITKEQAKVTTRIRILFFSRMDNHMDGQIFAVVDILLV